jgi:hypothetical protein
MNSLPKIRRSLVAEQLNHNELVAARLSIDRVTVNYTQSEKLAYQRGIDSAMQTVSQLKSKSEIATALLALSVAISESIDS